MSLLPNTVVNGNCLEVMKEIDDASIDMILCDLPYGATQNSWDSVIPPAPLWEQYERIIKPNGAILLFGQDKFTATMMLSNPKLHRYNIIWDKVLKSGFLNAKKMPLREHEDIMVFYKSPPPYHPQMTVGEKNHTKGKAVGKQAEDVHSNRSYGNYTLVESPDGNMKYPASIWRFPKPHPSVALHATEKPVDLLRYAIRTYTDRNAIVLDNCCGTGSTLIAAKLEGRRYIGIDNGVCDKKKSPYYGMPWAQVAQIRLEAIDHEPADEPERHRPLGEGTTEGVCTPLAYMLGITAELYPTSMTRLSNGVQPASSRNMPFGVRLLSPSSSTSHFDPLPLMTSNFFGWTMLHKMIPSFLWRNICPSRTLSCCMAGGSSTIKRP